MKRLYLFGIYGFVCHHEDIGIEPFHEVRIRGAIPPLGWGKFFELHHLETNMSGHPQVHIESFIKIESIILEIPNEYLVSSNW